MFVVRFLAGLCLLLAVIAGVSDLTRALNGTGWVMTSLAAHWKSLAPQSLTAAQQLVSRSVHPLVWDPLILRLLLLPTALLFASIGGMLAYLSRRQRRVNIFIN